MKKLILILGLVMFLVTSLLAEVVKVDSTHIQVLLTAEQKAKIAEVEAATGQKIIANEPVYTVNQLKALKSEIIAQAKRQQDELTKAITEAQKTVQRINALLQKAVELGVIEEVITP